MIFVAGAAEVKAVAVDGGLAGGDLRFKPGPGGVGDEAVAGEVRCCFDGISVCGAGVGFEEIGGELRRVIFLKPGLIGFSGDGLFGVKDGEACFVAVPAGDEGDVCLFAGGVDRIDGFGEEVAVDIAAKACRWRAGNWRGDWFQNFLWGERSEFWRGRLWSRPGVRMRCPVSRVLRAGRNASAEPGKAPPLSPIALARSLRESGEATCAETEKEPADSPKSVMLFGSPPKAAMLVWTQASAADWSSRP